MRATTCFSLLPAVSILLAVRVHRAEAYTYNVIADEDASAIGLNSIDKVRRLLLLYE